MTGTVNTDPPKSPKSITLMFKREKGDDPESKNGFRVKYKPDGQLFVNPKGMQFAGRVAKGKPKRCIACHQAAPMLDKHYKRIIGLVQTVCLPRFGKPDPGPCPKRPETEYFVPRQSIHPPHFLRV